MTRNELITELCRAEVLAKLRAIIGEETGVDLYELLEWKTVCLDLSAFARLGHFEALRVYPWRAGKPVKK